MKERCETCGRLTREGMEQVAARSRKNPIWGTDFSVPLSKIVFDLRTQIVKIRGKFYDIESAYPSWGEQVKDVTGLLTCGLIALHGITEQMKEYERKKEEG